MLGQASFVLALAVSMAAAGAPPPRMLWIWYPNPALKTSLPLDAGVAFIVASVYLAGSNDPVPFVRRAATALPPGAYRMGVIRIEHNRAAFTARQRADAARIVAEAVRTTRVPAVQIDFDAPNSARPFYRALLRDIRQRIGPSVFLSITALASWCGENSWLAGVDADELVPMLFQTGRESAALLDRPRSGARFPFEGCLGSVGVSTFGPQGNLSGRRVYIFPGNANWTPQSAAAALKAYRP